MSVFHVRLSSNGLEGVAHKLLPGHARRRVDDVQVRVEQEDRIGDGMDDVCLRKRSAGVVDGNVG